MADSYLGGFCIVDFSGTLGGEEVLGCTEVCIDELQSFLLGCRFY